MDAGSRRGRGPGASPWARARARGDARACARAVSRRRRAGGRVARGSPRASPGRAGDGRRRPAKAEENARWRRRRGRERRGGAGPEGETRVAMRTLTEPSAAEDERVKADMVSVRWARARACSAGDERDRKNAPRWRRSALRFFSSPEAGGRTLPPPRGATRYVRPSRQHSTAPSARVLRTHARAEGSHAPPAMSSPAMSTPGARSARSRRTRRAVRVRDPIARAPPYAARGR